MQEKQVRLQQRLGPEIQEFRTQCQTLLLATSDAQGAPNVSYSPFAWDEQGYYILVSDIARHAGNLKVRPNASMMLIEDETGSRQIYARKRLTFEVQAKWIIRDSDDWLRGTQLLLQRHGAIVQELLKMADFHLFCLVPQQGLYVKGFGQAFQVSGTDTIDLVHLDQGHQPVAGEKLPEPPVNS